MTVNKDIGFFAVLKLYQLRLEELKRMKEIVERMKEIVKGEKSEFLEFINKEIKEEDQDMQNFLKANDCVGLLEKWEKLDEEYKKSLELKKGKE
jgi:hypothetical protein